MTKYKSLSVSMISYIWTTFGWWSCLRILISRLILSTSFLSLIFDSSSTLTATCSKQNDSVNQISLNSNSLIWVSERQIQKEGRKLSVCRWDLPFLLWEHVYLAWLFQMFPLLRPSREYSDPRHLSCHCCRDWPASSFHSCRVPTIRHHFTTE